MESTVSKLPITDYYDLGNFHRPISTQSKDTQTWFNRGLIWTYAFNHEAAAECFQQAILHDENCALAYWGLAYCLGPNYNKPWEVFDEQEVEDTLRRTRSAALKAKQLSTTSIRVEQMLIDAIRFRYPEDNGEGQGSRSDWNKAYAQAMKDVYAAFPDDLDVATLYADALMNLTPWALWDLATGKPANDAHTIEIKTVVERALAQADSVGISHPGLLHLYIHLMEMSGSPESALTVADHLRGLVPDAGHLHHMPSHLDVLCGDYRRAIASNTDAIRADNKFLLRAGPMNFYTLYRCHDYHFRIYAAIMGGHSKIALQTVAELEASLPEALLQIESPPMADWLEGFLSVRLHTLVRFGRWQEIVDLAFPSDRTLFCVTYAMTCYAKGIAFAVTKQIEKAENMRTLFQQSMKDVKPSRTLFNNKCIDILAVAGAMLDGELQFQKYDDPESGYSHLRHAITLSDTLPYDEPWGWMQPPRHSYGALLLERGRVEEAMRVYRADLGLDNSLPRAVQHPNNVWALHGYHESLTKLGKLEEARSIGQQLKLAVAVADIEVKSSCFCRVLSESR